MATVLYRLGRFAFHRRWLVIGVWVALLGIVGIGAQQLSGQTSEAFSIPGTQSQQAMDLLEERTGSTADTGTARIVVQAPDGETLDGASATQAVEAVVADLSTLPHVVSVTDPFRTGALSADRGTAIITAVYDVQAAELTEADQEGLFEAADQLSAAGPLSTTAATRPRRRSARARRRRSASQSRRWSW